MQIYFFHTDIIRYHFDRERRGIFKAKEWGKMKNKYKTKLKIDDMNIDNICFEQLLIHRHTPEVNIIT